MSIKLSIPTWIMTTSKLNKICFRHQLIHFYHRIRFPNSSFGDILDDCDGKREIMTHESRIQTFQQGEKIHMILVGNGGANFRKLCPFRDQDGEVYFRNTEEFGAMKVEMDSKKLSATFLEVNKDVVYQVNLTR